MFYSISGKRFAIEGDCSFTLPAKTSVKFMIDEGGHWFGHGFAHRQPYPLETESIVNEGFAVNNTQSPVWLCSAGFAIFADTSSRLSVKFNAGNDRIFELTPLSDDVGIRIFKGANLPEAHSKLMKHLKWPGKVPAKELIGDSIFCTWTQFPRCISQERILQTALEIRENEFPCTVMTLDDKWESVPGDLEFCDDFPHPREMISKLHEMKFKVLLWVTPFINVNSKNFGLLESQRLLVMKKTGEDAALFKWWGGTAGLVDLTKPEAKKWYADRLLLLKNDIGVDGFKIDGGDAKYQPDSGEAAWHDYKGASGFNDVLLSVFEEICPGFCETRTVWLSQNRNILWRQGGKDSHWGIDNGLKAMVTYGLHTAVMGYDVSIPDMIPGRVQTMSINDPIPTDELFIRWTELSAFFASMQFSYFPWNYSKEVSETACAYAKLHKSIESYIMSEAENRKMPLLRPLWFESQDDEFFTVSDEFMLGKDLLVCPVVSEKQESRDILLPPGKWRDAWTGKTYSGTHVESHPAPCPGIPLFVRNENRALFENLSSGLKNIRRGLIKTGTCSATYSCGVNRDLKVSG
ncbi:MAG: glycoside hydrolase family 31 protein [Victivallales bacterium]